MLQPVQDQSDYPLTGQTSRLQRLWESGGFALTLQLPPLLTAETGNIMKKIVARAPAFDAVLTVDAPDGAIAVSSLATAVLLKRAGIEAIVRISGRDRNRLALQSDLLGLGALDIHTLLVDMQPLARESLGQNADARLVTDLDGPALLATAVRMRDEGRFISGASIKKRPLFYIGAFLPLELPIESAALSSAQFVVTPPVDDVQRFIAALMSFETNHADFLSTRPLLVSLPLSPAGTEEALEKGDMSTQWIVTAIEALKNFKEIHGFNIVVARQGDLAVLEQVMRVVDLRRALKP
ncbi:MAG TPA: hypothetical protein VFA09_16770 [Ktedonobacteraceae bacterium]|jgi:hypothetical protein|nr:hypothetical protein [Ktedonobacteraceae bacterium]